MRDGSVRMRHSGIRHLHGPAGARQLRLFAAAGAGACLLTAGTAAWLPGAAQAASLTFTVNTAADAHDAHPGDGICSWQRVSHRDEPLRPGRAGAACRSGPGFGRSGTMGRGPSMYEMEGPRPASRHRPADFSASFAPLDHLPGQQPRQCSGCPDHRLALGLPRAGWPGNSPSPNDLGFPPKPRGSK